MITLNSVLPQKSQYLLPLFRFTVYMNMSHLKHSHLKILVNARLNELLVVELLEPELPLYEREVGNRGENEWISII